MADDIMTRIQQQLDAARRDLGMLIEQREELQLRISKPGR